MNFYKLFSLTTLITILITKGYAQQDQLMIVEYVDWDPGAGLGVKIHNPTSNTIDLSNYYLTRYRDGETVPNDQKQMFGTLAPGQSKIFGNSAFCGDCSSGCNQIDIVGTNSQDVIAITLGATNDIVDMVGAYGSLTTLTVDGVDDAIFHNKLIRNSSNCIRYTDLAGTSENSWPDNDVENVTTWTVYGISCLSQGSVNFEVPNFNLAPDTTFCDENPLVLNVTAVNADSYEWIGRNNTTSSITITGAGSYVLKVGLGSCYEQDTINVTVQCDTTPVIPPVPTGPLYIPNIVTPNNDNINEKFAFTGMIESYPIELKVYNRWGKMVYQNEDYDQQWGGENLADGMYFYEINDVLSTYTGWLMIQR